MRISSRFAKNLCVIVVLLGIAAVILPLLEVQFRRANATMAVKQGKVMYVGLRFYAFDRDGILPPGMADSNASFRDLFRLGYLVDEADLMPRGTRNVKGARQGDNKVLGGRALERGEFGSTYWLHKDGIPTNIHRFNPNTPVLSIPMLSTGKKENFYTARYSAYDYAGQAVVTRADGSVVSYGIDDRGYLLDEEGGAIGSANRLEFEAMLCIYPDGVLGW